MKTYEITYALNPEFIGIKFSVMEDEDPEEIAIKTIDANGYSEWCDENGYASYDFEFEEIYDDDDEGF